MMCGWDFEVYALTRFWNCNMFQICELRTVILWYELNHRVRCAFGNVYLFCCIESEKQGGWWQGEASSLFIGHLTAQDQHYIFRNFFRIPLFSTRTNLKALKKCVHKILAVHLHNQ